MIQRNRRFFFGVLLASAFFSHLSLWADLIRIDGDIEANGYGATGNYHGVLVGNGLEWTFRLLGVANGDIDKPALSYIEVDLFDQSEARLAFDITHSPTGFSTSDGSAYTNTSPWTWLQCCGPTQLLWIANSADQRVAPFGENMF